MDIYYNITPLQQPKSNDCWITALTLMKRYKENDNNFSIDDALQVLGEPYEIFYDTNRGLPGDYFEDFLQKGNLFYYEPQNFTLRAWVENLKNHGPLLVDVLSSIIDNKAWTHTRVLVGLEINEMDRMASRFIFLDPAEGQESEETYDLFLQNYEAEPENQIVKIQVAYSI